MRTFVELLCWIAAAMLQWQWENHFSVYGLSPDFIFISSLALASFSSETRGSVWAFSAGLYADMYYGSPLGANALAYTVSAWIAKIVAQRFDLYDRLTQAAVVFLFSWPAYLSCWIVSSLFANDSWMSLKYFCAVPFFNAVFAPFVFSAVLAIKRVLRMEEKF